MRRFKKWAESDLLKRFASQHPDIINRLMWKKYAIFTIALLFISLAVLIFLECRLGSDSLTVLLDGLHLKLDVAYSTASGLYNGAIVLIALLVARRYVGLGSVLYMFHIVLFLAIFERIFPLFHIPDQSFFVRLMILLVGQVLLSLGIALLISASFGMNSLDAILHRIEDRTRFSYRGLRTFVDIAYVSAGFLMGGVVGIGTIISVLTTGTMIVWFRKRLDRPISRFYFKQVQGV